MELNTEFFDWINKHINDNTASLRMKMHGKLVAGIDANIAILQIECRRKYAAKFSETLTRDPLFFFPGSINAEQATSDRLADFHERLITENTRVADMTAGLGIDAMHVAGRSKHVTAIEYQPEVAEALHFNAANSRLSNIDTLCADCRKWIIDAQDDSYDYLFIDPARRSCDGGRVYALADCEPNLVALQNRMLEIAPKYIAKLSPMLDISHLAGELLHLKTVIALGTSTECKELIALADRRNSDANTYNIEAVTLLPDGSEHSICFTPDDERNAVASYGMPSAGDFLFEPWPSVMKAAPLKWLSEKYSLTKIAANTHLYHTKNQTAPEQGLPGNCLKINEVIPYSSSEIKRFARRWPKISVSVRNFGLQADALRKKLGVQDGGGSRVFGVSDQNGKKWLIVAS